MDELVISQKLESLRRSIARIEKKRPSSVAELESNSDLQDIIVLNLTRAVQLCVDIASHIISKTDSAAPASMGESFSILASLNIIDSDLATQLKKATGFRNAAINNYETINWTIVHAISHKELSGFKEFTKSITIYCQL